MSFLSKFKNKNNIEGVEKYSNMSYPNISIYSDTNEISFTKENYIIATYKVVKINNETVNCVLYNNPADLTTEEKNNINKQIDKIEIDGVLTNLTSTYRVKDKKENDTFTAKIYFKRCFDFTSLFDYNLSLVSCDLSHLKTIGVRSFKRMFLGCHNLKSINFANIDTRNVLDMNRMFFNCQQLSDVDFSVFDVSSVKDMSHMFHSCKMFTQTIFNTIKGWNFDVVENTSAMFSSCSNNSSEPITEFIFEKQFTNVKDLSTMFSYAFNTQKISINIGIWTNNLGGTFSGLDKLTHLEIYGISDEETITTTTEIEGITYDIFNGIPNEGTYVIEDNRISAHLPSGWLPLSA